MYPFKTLVVSREGSGIWIILDSSGYIVKTSQQAVPEYDVIVFNCRLLVFDGNNCIICRYLWFVKSGVLGSNLFSKLLSNLEDSLQFISLFLWHNAWHHRWEWSAAELPVRVDAVVRWPLIHNSF